MARLFGGGKTYRLLKNVPGELLAFALLSTTHVWVKNKIITTLPHTATLEFRSAVFSVSAADHLIKATNRRLFDFG